MRYEITAKSPASSPVEAIGSWIIEASSAEEALQLLDLPAKEGYWPKDSTWTIRLCTIVSKSPAMVIHQGELVGERV